LNFRKAPMKERLSNKVKEVLSGKQHNPHARFESKELFNRLNRQQRILYGPLVTAGHVKEEE